MNKGWPVLRRMLGVIGLLGIAPGLAMAGGILPVDASGNPIPGSAVTVSLFQNGVDVTDSWLPEPGQEVDIVVNGGSGGIQMISTTGQGEDNPPGNQALTTSAYPGACTNFPAVNPGEPVDTSADFELVSSSRLRANDCGGMAVIQVDNLTFVLPRDSDFDGMPDVWEKQFCQPGIVTCLQPEQDIELQGANPERGDGDSNFDEYRGKLVSLSDPAPGIQVSDEAGKLHKHVRFSPHMKDVFFALRNPACRRVFADTTVGASLLSGPNAFPLDGTSLFAGLFSLGGVPASSTAARVHFIGFTPGQDNGPSDEWVDNLVKFEPFETPNFQYTGGVDGPLFDRQVNSNAVYPQGAQITDSAGAPHLVQKGIRMIECLNIAQNSPIGFAQFPPGTQQGTPNEDTNAIIFSERISKDYDLLLLSSGSRGKPSGFEACAKDLQNPCVLFSTFQNGGWTDPVTQVNNIPVDRNFIVSKYIQYVVAMEIGHSVNLIPEIHTTEFGAHFSPGSGDNLDQRVIAKDSKKEGGVIYRIPSIFGQVSNEGFHLH